MANGTCIEDDCENPPEARGLCIKHYGALYRAGLIGEPRRPSLHAITDVDIENRLGTCATCGPGIHLRLYARKDGTFRTVCSTASHGVRKSRAKTISRRRGRLPALTPPPPRDKKWEKYGITTEEFLIRVEAQQSKCLICKNFMEKPVIDHCHQYGHVRGILCNLCNSGLGFFKDDPEALLVAAQYVRRYRKVSA